MPKKKKEPELKWCPGCHQAKPAKGFRSWRCKECWIEAGKPKTEKVVDNKQK